MRSINKAQILTAAVLGMAVLSTSRALAWGGAGHNYTARLAAKAVFCAGVQR